MAIAAGSILGASDQNAAVLAYVRANSPGDDGRQAQGGDYPIVQVPGRYVVRRRQIV